MNKRGMSLLELLIVIAILLVVIGMGIVNWYTQTDKAFDARKKGELVKIKAAFEEYFNDNACYPAVSVMSPCGGNQLAPYLRTMPCDPQTGDPYLYEPVNPGNVCAGFRLYTVLKITDDADIARQGCDGANGCGAIAGPAYNYGVSSGVPVKQ